MKSIHEILNLLGSLAILIYGMQIMSSGLQKVVGEQFKTIVNSFTKSRLYGLLSGIGITIILQSSTVVSVALIGLVSVEIISVVNSYTVIIGANIGTTLTAWLAVLYDFNHGLELIAMPMFVIGLPMLMAKSRIWRYRGQAVFGFGLLMLGLIMIGNATPNAEDIPFLIEFASYSEPNLSNVILFLIIGFIATLILQTSSGTIILIIILSQKGWIGYELAVAMIMGSNVGTTMTAFIAGLLTGGKGKHVAYFHFTFNFLGAVLGILFFKAFIGLNDYLIVHFFHMDSPFVDQQSLPLALALSHTIFNIISAIVFIGFTQQIYNIFEKYLFGNQTTNIKKDFTSGFKTTSIHLAEVSVLSLSKSLYKYGDIFGRLYEYINQYIFTIEDEKREYIQTKITEYNDINIRIQREIDLLLNDIGQQELSAYSTKRVKAIIEAKEILEDIVKMLFELHSIAILKLEKKIWFSENQRQYLKVLFQKSKEMYERTIKIIDDSKNVGIDYIDLNKLELNSLIELFDDVNQKFRSKSPNNIQGEKTLENMKQKLRYSIVRLLEINESFSNTYR